MRFLLKLKSLLRIQKSTTFKMSPSCQKDPRIGQDRRDDAGGPETTQGGALPVHVTSTPRLPAPQHHADPRPRAAVPGEKGSMSPTVRYDDDKVVRYSEFRHDTNGKNQHENEALIVLLKRLLITTQEWSIQYGCESVPPGVLLQQACTMIDAAEIIFKDD